MSSRRVRRTSRSASMTSHRNTSLAGACFDAGLPRGAFRLAFGDTPTGPHTVLLVWTDKGEFALDNRKDEVIDFRRMIFYTVSMQDAANPRVWWEMH